MTRINCTGQPCSTFNKLGINKQKQLLVDSQFRDIFLNELIHNNGICPFCLALEKLASNKTKDIDSVITNCSVCRVKRDDYYVVANYEPLDDISERENEEKKLARQAFLNRLGNYHLSGHQGLLVNELD